jgi:hypothetical protein
MIHPKSPRNPKNQIGHLFAFFGPIKAHKFAQTMPFLAALICV